MSELKLSVSVAKKLLRLLEGEKLPSSSLPEAWKQWLLQEGMLDISTRGSTQSYRVHQATSLHLYLQQHFTSDMPLEKWIELMERKEATRAEQVAEGGHSKMLRQRSFRGFLLNSYQPIAASMGGEPFLISPPAGTSLFIEQFEQLRLPEQVVVVGMENGENFQHIRQQQYLFEGMDVVFVSRYPQSGDLLSWLEMIPNPYLHFGDFDLAGVQIFLSEFYARLGERASFFIPQDIEQRLQQGNRALYEQQYARYKDMSVGDPRVESLVCMIRQYGRGYEQEGYII